MLADARDGLFDVIVCWKSDRLSRGIYPAAALMEVIEAQQIRLESVTDSIDMKTFGILAAVGKVEIDNFRERATLGKRGSARRGRMPIGSLAYGYRIGEDGNPEVDPLEGPIIQRIFRGYVYEGQGVSAISKGLTEDLVPLRKGSKWHSWSVSHIHRILGREVYKGTGWYGRERHVTTEDGRKRFPQPKETWIPIAYPPLVDEETWVRAQAMKQERRILAKRNTRSFYLLQHLLICEECGLGFTVRTNNRNTVRRNGRTYRYEYAKPSRYYKCQGMHSHGLQCHERPYLKADALEELVWCEVASVLKKPDIILRGLQEQSVGQDDTALDIEIARTEREVRAMQTEEDRAIRLHVAGKITEAQLDRQQKFITERLEQVQSKLDRLRANQRAVQQRKCIAEGVIMWAKEVETGLDALTPEERQKVLRLVLDRVGINREGKVRIGLAIPVPEFVSDVSQQTSCWWRP
jgi:site-specific DNA recombinase